MKPVYVTQVGAGVSDWKMVNWNAQQVQIGIGVAVTGIATYTVEYTYDDLNNLPDGATEPTVYSHPTLQGLTQTSDGSFTTPVAFIRLNQTAGAGSTRMTILQSDLVG